MNTLRAAGILAGSVSQIEGISPNFDLPAILRTWAMQMSAGFPLNARMPAARSVFMSRAPILKASVTHSPSSAGMLNRSASRALSV